MKTVIGIFDEGSDLSGALNELERAGLDVSRVVDEGPAGGAEGASGSNPPVPVAAGTSMPGGAVVGQGSAAAPTGFLSMFNDLDVPEDEREYLDDSVAHGAKLIIVKADADNVGAAVDILGANGASRVHDPRA